MQTRRSQKVYMPPGLVPSVVLSMRCTVQTVWGPSEGRMVCDSGSIGIQVEPSHYILDTQIWIAYYCPALPALQSIPSPSHMTLPVSGERTSLREPIIRLSLTLCAFHRRFRCSLSSPNSISQLTSRSVTVHSHSIMLQVLSVVMCVGLGNPYGFKVRV
jgi:hypothetical protein